MTDRQQSYTIHSRYVVAQKDKPRTHYISFGFNHDGVSTGVPAIYQANKNYKKNCFQPNKTHQSKWITINSSHNTLGNSEGVLRICPHLGALTGSYQANNHDRQASAHVPFIPGMLSLRRMNLGLIISVLDSITMAFLPGCRRSMKQK